MVDFNKMLEDRERICVCGCKRKAHHIVWDVNHTFTRPCYDHPDCKDFKEAA